MLDGETTAASGWWTAAEKVKKANFYLEPCSSKGVVGFFAVAAFKSFSEVALFDPAGVPTVHVGGETNRRWVGTWHVFKEI